MKILTILGARPQFIKAAAFSSAVLAAPGVREVIVHTGQHHDDTMSKIFFEELQIPPPQYHLAIAGGGHGDMTGRMLIALEPVVMREQPDWILVFGDTNSTLAGALTGAKLHVPVAHVEAGLRSHNRRMPEEINRVLTDHCSTLLFTPTQAASANLAAEGITAERVVEVGDVMFDATRLFAGRDDPVAAQLLTRTGALPRRFVLATVHRQENTDSRARLVAILEGLQRTASDLPVLFPLHPRTRKQIDEFGLGKLLAGLHVLEPLGYRTMIALQRDAAIVVTDSGGVQKEAFFQRVPCVTLRDETEWTELVHAGWNRLAPPRSAESVARTIADAIGATGADIAPYGDGHASQRILDSLLNTTGSWSA